MTLAVEISPENTVDIFLAEMMELMPTASFD